LRRSNNKAPTTEHSERYIFIRGNVFHVQENLPHLLVVQIIYVHIQKPVFVEVRIRKKSILWLGSSRHTLTFALEYRLIVGDCCHFIGREDSAEGRSAATWTSTTLRFT
jgi:hypothetical protein